MKQLGTQEIKIISGGSNGYTGFLFDAGAAILGGYLGTSLAYLKPLMAYTVTGQFATKGVITTAAYYSPQTTFILCGAMLGASIGYAISHGIQLSLYPDNN